MRLLPPLALVLVAATTTGCSLFGDDGTLDAGDVVRAQEGAVDTDATGTRDVWLQLPEGRLELTVAPVDAVASDDTLGEDDLEPADGARLLAVTWNVTTEGASTTGLALGGLGTAPGSLSISAGSASTVLDDRWRRTGAAYVALPDSGALSIAMDLDGLTQSVDVATGDRDVPAPAQPLYDEPTDPESVPCTDFTGTDGFTAKVSCRLELTTAPYADGAGWSTADALWHVVTADVSLDAVTAADGSTYAATSADGALTLDDNAPVATVQTPATDPSGLGQVVQVFDGTSPALLAVVDRTFALEKRSGAGPDTASYTVSSTTPLG